MRNIIRIAVAVTGLALLGAACSTSQDASDEAARSEPESAAIGGFARGQDDSDGAAVASIAVGDSAGAFPAPSSERAGSADLLGRTIIRSGSVALEVESVDASFEAVRSIAVANGGFVADSTFFGGSPTAGGANGGRDEGPRFAALALRIPAERFEQVVADLRGLAIRVTSISTSSQDVTGEVTDLESDLRNLRAVESQYLTLLGRADAIGDVLQVQDRINQTRAQIERAEGRLALLESLADLATLRVELQAPGTPVVAEGGSSGPLDAARAGWEASLDTLRNIASVGLATVAYSWWLLPFITIALVALRRWGAPLRRPRATMDTSRGST